MKRFLAALRPVRILHSRAGSGSGVYSALRHPRVLIVRVKRDTLHPVSPSRQSPLFLPAAYSTAGKEARFHNIRSEAKAIHHVDRRTQSGIIASMQKCASYKSYIRVLIPFALVVLLPVANKRRCHRT